MKRIRLLLTLIVGLLAVGACAHSGSQMPPVQGEPFILEVHNPQPQAMNVRFVLAGSALTTLGQVNAGETLRWSIPNRGQDDIRLEARTQEGGPYFEETLELESGQVVRWEIR